MARMQELAASGQGKKKMPSISVRGGAARLRRGGERGAAGEERGEEGRRLM